MPVIVYIPSSVLFPAEPTDFETFVDTVKGLSRTDALFWCARLNHFLSHPGGLSLNARQSHVAVRFLSSEQQGLATAWARREGHQREHVTLFFRAQLLQLALWVALLSEDNENDGMTFEDPQVRRNFTKAAMIAGELWNDAVFHPRNFEGTNLPKVKRNAIPALREGIAAIRQRDPLHVSLARGNAFYGPVFHAHYPQAELDMERATGLSIRDYLSCAAMLTYYNQSDWEEPTLDKPLLYNIAFRGGMTPHAASVFDKYFRRVSQTPEELSRKLREAAPNPCLAKGALSVLCLREKPFVATGDGRTIALDAQFAYDKLTLGPLFELCRIGGQQAFSSFGYSVEGYVQDLVKATTPDAPSLAARVTCNPKSSVRGTEREFADVLWQLEGASFCIVEIKASFVPDVALRADDPEDYVEAFRKKFSSPSTESSRAQGTYQLAQTIRSIGANEIQLEGCAGLEPTIYPLLVVFDRGLDGPGHADVLGTDFRNALGLAPGVQLPTVRVGCARVRPLVVATVGDMEFLQESLARLSLKQVLDDYIAWMNHGNLHDFLAYNATRLGIRENKLLADQALEFLEGVGELFFGTRDFTKARR